MQGECGGVRQGAECGGIQHYKNGPTCRVGIVRAIGRSDAVDGPSG